MADLDAAFLEAKNQISDAESAIQQFSTRRRDIDRSFIAWMVIGTFVAVTVVLAIYVIRGEWASREKQAEFLLKVVSSVLLPVVTLVIGYYFGKEQGAER